MLTIASMKIAIYVLTRLAKVLVIGGVAFLAITYLITLLRGRKWRGS
jgi:hypothetical protein